MPVPLEKIDGLMLPNKSLTVPCATTYNKAIDDQGKRKIGNNKEKAVNAILKLWRKYDRLKVQVDSQEEAEQIVDAIIKDEAKIIEFVEE